MVLDPDGCQHAKWRTDFAANGKLHEFCLTCGAERRISQTADGGEAARLRNGLRWMRHVAAMNALGTTAGPQQMRALAALAEKVLDGAELADYDSSIGAARGKAQDWASSVGIDLRTADQLQRGAGSDPAITHEPRRGNDGGALVASLPDPRPQPEQAPPQPAADAGRTEVVLDGQPS